MEENVIKETVVKDDIILKEPDLAKVIVPDVADYATTEDLPNDYIAFTIEDKEVQIFGTETQRQAMFSDYAKYFEEVSNPENTTINTFFRAKYAPLNEVLNSIRPILGKYGFGIIQVPTFNGTNCLVNTMLTHSSGGCITFPALENKPTKPDIQGMGSVLTYLRRFSLNAYFGVMGEVDDDGNAGAKKDDKKSEVKVKPTSKATEACIAYISKSVDDDDKKTRNAKIVEVAKEFTSSGKIKDVKDTDSAAFIKKIKELDK